MDDIELSGNQADDFTSALAADGHHDGTGTAPAHWTRALLVRQGNGVRSEAAAAVHLVCDTGMYSLDAALQERDVSGWFVIGQLFLRRNNAPAEAIEVVLHVDEQPVDSARTDAFGEFAFPSRGGSRIGVALNGPERARIELWRKD